MSELIRITRLRGFTRAKLTKSLSKADAAIEADKINEMSALISTLQNILTTLTDQNQQVLELIADNDVDEEIEVALDYEIKVEEMINSLRQCLDKKSPISKNTSNVREGDLSQLAEVLRKQNEV